ncbi:MAG: GNAT family N-acetyltransferase [Lentimicrobiaceae bacterium]|jgi:diamine N-acetyltransferase|nr:GNAT family N-acetyltransferase [Lentimicrobiaceae bacterium]
MFFEGKEIYLRAAEPIDAQQIFVWENDVSVWRMGETLSPYSLYQIEQFTLGNNDIFANRQIRLMIDRNEDKKTVGCIDIYDFEPFHLRAGIGILISREMRRKGYAKEALTLLHNYVFDVLLLHQTYCYVNVDNADSIRLFEMAGYERTGIRKAWIKTKDGFIDQFVYQNFNTNK